MLPYLGWISFALNLAGIGLYFSFGGPANTERNHVQRIVSQLGLLMLLAGLGLQLAALVRG